MFRTANRIAVRSTILRRAAASTALTGALLLPHLAQAQTVPAGGVPVSLGVTIGSPTGNANGGLDLGVSQTETRGIVNWQTFDLGRNDRITFDQPTGGATLNRVTGGTASTIAGQIVANGSVYLVNPNGIAITATGNVQTGGGFIASTLDITDENFVGSANTFTGTGASAAVSNAGSITGNGFVALLGGTVSHGGTITVPAGRVALASGEQITLDLNGGDFLTVTLPTNATAADGKALIEAGGSITVQSAPGNDGVITIAAATAANAVRNAINVSGALSANRASGQGGVITLSGGVGGAVTVSGSVTSRARSIGGGAIIEGDRVNLKDAIFNLASTADGGTGGALEITASAITANGSLSSALDTTRFANFYAVRTGTGDGAIRLTGAMASSGTGTVLLQARTDISLAGLTARNVQLTINAGDTVAYAGAVGSSGAIDVDLFNLTNGNWSQTAATLPTFAARDFRFNVTRARFLRVTGGSGMTATPYTIADVYGLQGMASGAYLASAFALANAIDASGTENWNDGAGFVAIGTDGNGNIWNGNGFSTVDTNYPGFSGGFTGSGFAIGNLTINRDSNYQGLFGFTSGAGINNVKLAGGSIKGGSNVGALVGYTNAAVSRSSASSTVTGASYIGGLVGTNGANGSITGSSASGVVNGSGNGVGGLVGDASGSISTSFATGNVTGLNNVGGLVGTIRSGTATINQTYASGAVLSTMTATVSSSGGLVGNYLNSSSLSRSYATGSVTANSTNANIGGLVGTSRALITQSYATGRIGTTGRLRGGLVGQVTANPVRSSNFWDSYSTGAATAVGSGAVGGTPVAVTSDPAQAQAANYAYKTSAYTGTGGLTAADWVFFDGQTRPFGAWEAVAPGGTITNSHQLQLIGRANAAALAGSYTLGGNIDLAETGRATVGNAASYAGMWAPTGFVSLGTDGAGNVWNGTAFVPLAANAAAYGYGGTFDGGGFALTGLSIARPTAAYTGLFGVTNGRVQNVTVTGSVSGASTTGGLVGFLYRGGRVTGSSSAVNVRASGTIVGGLIGSAGSGTLVRFSDASGTVNGTTNVGGLIGYASDATVDRSFATGAASGTSYIGGLIGYSYIGTMTDSYARGAAMASNTSAGGLIGKIVGGSVARTYSTGAVTAATRAGGLIGAADASANVSASYWDTQTNNQAVSAGGMGRTTAQLRDSATYAGWDFGAVWTSPTATTYPTLRPATQQVQ